MVNEVCQSGGTGRHDRFKTCYSFECVGSTPTFGTGDVMEIKLVDGKVPDAVLVEAAEEYLSSLDDIGRYPIAILVSLLKDSVKSHLY